MSRITRPAKRTHVRHSRLSPRRLDELIDQASVDAYGPAEQAVGFHATLEQELALPFDTIVLGVTVSVRKLDVTDRGEVVAVCYRGRDRSSIPRGPCPSGASSDRLGVDRSAPPMGAGRAMRDVSSAW
jgi:hypothetical protein